MKIVTLVAVLCHLAAGVNVPLCEEVAIPTVDKHGVSLLAAGKADDPQDIPFTEKVCEVNAQRLIAWYVTDVDSPYYGWVPIGKHKCDPDYVPRGRA